MTLIRRFIGHLMRRPTPTHDRAWLAKQHREACEIRTLLADVFGRHPI